MHNFWTYKLPKELEVLLSSQLIMKPVSTACIETTMLNELTGCITIDHEILNNISCGMLQWWHRYFCYQQIETADGLRIPAFHLWHPQDHGNVLISQHSLSGELGLVRGAHARFIEKIGNASFASNQVKIVQNHQHGITVDYYENNVRSSRVIEQYFDTTKGLQYRSLLYSKNMGNVTSNGNHIISTLQKDQLNNWVKHKIEEVGNLDVILPPIYRLESKKYFA